MKRITALLAAFVITAALAGCGGSENPREPASDTPDKVSQRLSQTYADMMKKGKFMMRYKATLAQDGTNMNVEITAAMDGENVDCIITGEDGMSFHSLITDDALYFIDDVNKTYMEMPITSEEETAPELDIVSDEDFSYTGSGTGTVDGKTLPYEEYAAGEENMRYYFDGKELYAIVVSGSDGETVMRILEISDKIPSGMLKIPAGYTENAA